MKFQTKIFCIDQVDNLEGTISSRDNRKYVKLWENADHIYVYTIQWRLVLHGSWVELLKVLR